MQCYSDLLHYSITRVLINLFYSSSRSSSPRWQADGQPLVSPSLVQAPALAVALLHLTGSAMLSSLQDARLTSHVATSSATAGVRYKRIT